MAVEGASPLKAAALETGSPFSMYLMKVSEKPLNLEGRPVRAISNGEPNRTPTERLPVREFAEFSE